ncbi:MAG: flagellar motor switch protein FliN [Leptospirales bacterium]|nr:flagellar motor switch protein FliN [Leptospirales bacterium]
MGDGSLTQEEIDLLLQGADDISAAPVTGGAQGGPGQGGGELSPLEREAVADAVHTAIQSAAQSLGLILSKSIRLGTPYADARSFDDVQKEFAAGSVLFSQNLSGGISGTLGIMIPVGDGARISGMVMGNEGAAATATLDSAQVATLKDAIGPMMFSAATQLSIKISQAITPMPVEVKTSGMLPFAVSDGSNLLRVQIPFTIEGAVDTRLTVLLSMQTARDLYRRLKSGPSASMDSGMADMGRSSGETRPTLGVKEVSFPSLSTASAGPLQPNMNLLLDVQMTLTVELGRTKMFIKDILGLGEGSIIELDKLAGEPVDLYVNDRLIARGEVVVIDENFGVRVTDIVSRAERLKAQKQG